MTELATNADKVRVDLGERSYDILIGRDLLANAGQLIGSLAKRSRVFVLTDANVAEAHLEKLKAGLAASGLSALIRVEPPGEGAKSFVELEACLSWLLDAQAGRDDTLVALGGGVVGDLAGLAASLMKRGMDFVQAPTTLLAQVDSSVGGKTAINTRHGKNLIGAFHQPRLVLADTTALDTLPVREMRAGYAEIVKYGLIDDPDFFDWLERHGEAVVARDTDAVAEAVARSCRAKARIVAQDERESGVRALLNLGHTFGHALEGANDFGPDLLHGEAVGCGLALAMRYSVRLGVCSAEDAERAERVLNAGGLRTRLANLAGGPYDPTDLVERMRQDKKGRAGRIPLILARGVGRSYILPDADLDDVRAFLESESHLR